MPLIKNFNNFVNHAFAKGEISWDTQSEIKLVVSSTSIYVNEIYVFLYQNYVYPMEHKRIKYFDNLIVIKCMSQL